MSVFQWSEDYCTGLAEVDRQHHQLVDMLNGLDEARTIGSDARSLLGLLDGLAAYTQYHFDSENVFMNEPHYDQREAQRHQAEHAEFIHKVAQVQAEAQRNPTVVSDDLMGYLAQWLSQHILGTDMRMAAQLLQVERQDVADGTDVLVRALAESEARFRGIADHIPALIWMTDAQGQRSYYNQQWTQYTGLDQKQLLQDAWLDCVHPDDKEGLQRLHAKLRDTHAEGQLEYRLRRADGRYRWFWQTVVPRFHSDGEFAGEVSCAFDVTERRQVEKLLRGAKQRLEQMVKERTEQLSKANQILKQRIAQQQALTRELQQTQAQLLQSEKMAGIGQLAAGVAHEINNPIGYVYSNLSTLKGYSDDLLNLLDAYAGLETRLPPDDSQRVRLQQLREQLDLDFLREDIPQLVQESMQGADRARQIVQHLKDFTGLDQHERGLFDLEAGLQSTLEMLGEQMTAGVQVLREYAGLEPIVGVGAELNQVFLQLLTNALQAVQGKGSVTLRTGSDAAQGVWVEVRDTGPGIAKQNMNRLFDPFFTTKPVGQGTGMGLALAYKIVQQHGGRIEVDSEPGAGACFRVWLPRTDQALAETT